MQSRSSASGRPWKAALAGFILCAISGSTARAVDPFAFPLNLHSSYGDTQLFFESWIPDDVDHLRGMVVALPGSGGDTRNITRNISWRLRLRALGFGIIGMRDVPDPIYYWGVFQDEGEQNVQSMLDSVADWYGHPEIKNAPLIMEGISKGGFAAFQLAHLVPDRTICYVADKGITFPSYVSTEESVPGLVIGGQTDPLVPPSYLGGTYESMRSDFDSSLALAIDWRKGHTETATDLKLAYMAQALRARYPQNQLPSLIPGNPLPLINTTDFADVWLGESNRVDPLSDRFTPVGKPQIAPEADYNLDPTLASWLPTEAMAKVYQSHNDANFLDRLIFLSTSNPPGKKYILLNARSFGGPNITHIDIYHDEELVGVVDTAAGQSTFRYFPRDPGFHTFLGVADYNDNGVIKQVSNYAVGIAAEGVPEPASLLLLATATLATLCYPRAGKPR